MCLRTEDEGMSRQLDDDLAKLATAPAGPLHKALRGLGLPEELDQRIADAIHRRNQIVHHMTEDPRGGDGDGHRGGDGRGRRTGRIGRP